MNIPTDVAKTAIEALKGAPVILGLLLLNMLMLVGFWLTLHGVAGGIERRDAMIKACIERGA